MAVHRLERLVGHTLTRLGITKKMHLLLGISGGRDSSALLIILKNIGYQVVAAHMNYGLRGEASEEDERFCKHICGQLGIPLFTCQAHSEMKDISGEGTQALARRIRYTWFKLIAVEIGADAILTAHHAGDQVETYLLNVLRGNPSRLPSGIPEKSGRLIRPMLLAQPDWITDYLHQHQQSWREDQSNAMPVYLRNRIRHELLPLLKTIYPGAERKLIARAKAAHERQQGERAILSLLLSHSSRNKIRFSPALNPEPEVLRWLIARWGERWHVSRNEVTILKNLVSAHAGTRIALSSREAWVREEHALVLVCAPDLWQPFCIPAPGSGSFESDGLRCAWYLRCGGYEPEFPGFQMDAEAIHWPLCVRPWQPGDRIRMYGAHGSRNVSDILNDIGIHHPVKRNFAVLEDQKGLVAVMGGRIAAHVAVHSGTRQVFHFSITIPDA